MQVDRSDVQLNAALRRAGQRPPRHAFDMRAELEALLEGKAVAAAAQDASQTAYALKSKAA